MNEHELITAAAQHLTLTEGSDINRFLHDTAQEARDYHPSDVLQVASALINGAARRIRVEDPAIGDKLLTLTRQLDRIIDSY
jgi:hypothetical protein